MPNEILQRIGKHKESISTLLNIFGALSIFGLFTSFIIFYKYFNLHNLELQTPDNFVIVMSVIWLIFYVTLLFTLIVGWIVSAGEELQETKTLELKEQKELRSKLLLRNIFKIIVYDILMYCIVQDFDNDNSNITVVLLVLISIIFFIIGLKVTYKFSKKAKITLSFDYLIFLIIAVFYYMFFIYGEEHTFLPILLMFPTLIMIYLLPFIFIESSDKTSILKFTTIIYLILTLLFISFMPTVFLENTIKDLHLGNIHYKKLVLDKSECTRLNEYDLGYTCDDNNSLSDIVGVWIQTEKPIFQKKDMNSTKPQIDKTSTKVWLYRNKIQSVL